jgi:hypothetical protein
VFVLDGLFETKGRTKTERQTLQDLICGVAHTLLEDGGADDAELRALFAKHAQVEFDEDQKEALLAMKSMAEAMTGLDLGEDEGIGTDADLFERMQAKLQEHLNAEDMRREQAQAKKKARPKSAAQQRREEEAQQVTQSVRDIFRKLASALHPDRESDETKREAKTAMMQRVNQAYAGNDLLALLELQLEVEQIEEGHLKQVGEERLKHYNKVLAEQLKELKAQLQHVEMAFSHEFGWRFNQMPSAQVLDQLLERRCQELREEVSEQQRDLEIFNDAVATKAWLKQQRQALRRMEAEEFDPFMF